MVVSEIANRERYVKKHFLGKPQTGVVRAPAGFAKVVQNEFQQITSQTLLNAESATQVRIDGSDLLVDNVSLEHLVEFTLRSLTAEDVFWTVGKGRARTWAKFEEIFSTVRWDILLPPKANISVVVESVASELFHETAIKEKLLALFKIRGVNQDSESLFRVHCVLKRDVVNFQLSLAGQALWKRGYRLSLGGNAPLRESIAASAIQQSLIGVPNYSPDAVVVPFAGSGTLGFESLLFFGGRAPATFRDLYACEAFGFSLGNRILFLRRKLLELQNPLPPVTLLERESAACEVLRASTQHFSLKMQTQFSIICDDALSQSWKLGEQVFLPLNPPYNLRLRGGTDVYKHVGEKIADLKFSIECRGFVLAGREDDWRALLSAAPRVEFKTTHISQGGLDVRLVTF